MKGFPRSLAGVFVAVVMLLAVPASATDSAPEQLVRSTTNEMLALFVENREMIENDPRSLYGLVDDVVLPHFDFQRMSQWALGKYWRRASNEQRARFTEAFRNLLVNTYSSLLFDYTNQTIDYLPARTTQDGSRVTVRTVINDTDGRKIPIDYALYRRDSDWQVYDVTIEGVSLVSNYRSSFASEIRTRGLDALIDRLVQRNTKTAT